jgi:DNA adenine methylase
MRYVGGKSKLSKAIGEEVAARKDGCHTYLEPFIGGAATLAVNAPMFECAYASDVSADLVLMWNAVRDGWLPEGGVTEEEYEAQRLASPSAQRGFVGFGCSFGGKWFGGRARGGTNKGGIPRDHSAESARAVAKLAPGIKSVDEIKLCDYGEWRPERGWLVYADPPYNGTQGYGAAGLFISSDFWHIMDRWHLAGAVVLVSEYTAPAGWKSVMTKSHIRSLQHGRDGRHVTTESLWMHE